MDDQPPPRLTERRVQAGLVHLFTASGILCGLAALLAVLAGRIEQMYLWLGLALIIDGADGYFARRVGVKAALPRFSGEQLDLVVDYVTYVFVPAFALLYAGPFSRPVGLLLATLILLSSLYHFSDTQSKTEDHCFVGFPAIWNLVAFHIHAFGLGPWLSGALVLTCVVLTFVPFKWVHPLRVIAMRPLTLAASVAWAIAALTAVFGGFPATSTVQVVLLAVAIYGVGLSVLWGRAAGRGGLL
jgi:phosphatidylcholine synthase